MRNTANLFGDQVLEGLKTFRRFIVRKSDGEVAIKAGDGFTDVEIDGRVIVTDGATLDRIESQLAEVNRTLTVGAGGDYPTLQTAVDAAASFPAQPGTEQKITINILSGTTITERLRVFNRDCSGIEITSDDATVTATVTTELFAAYRAKLPQIGALFDMGSAGGHGIICSAGSYVEVASGCGVKNAGNYGVYGDCSRINIDNAVFTGAVNNGVDIRYGSLMSARGCDASGAGNYAFAVSYGSQADLYGADGSNSLRALDVAGGCMVSAQNFTGTGCSGYGVHVTSSCCEVYNSDVSGCTGVNGVYSAYSANINAVLVNAACSGASGSDFSVSFGGIIAAHSGTGTLSIAKNTLLANGIIFQ